VEIRTFKNGSFIRAKKITTGKKFQVGERVAITCRDEFTVGDFGRFGDDVEITAESVTIGNHFFHYTRGLRVGGGGSQSEESILSVGDRCVFHDNYINLAAPVNIYDDVGLSPGVEILTHGFWESILEGNPYSYENVDIYSNTIIGQRSLILPGVSIAEGTVVGAGSVVTKSIHNTCEVWAGNPARKIKDIVEPTVEQQEEIAKVICRSFKDVVDLSFPYVTYKSATLDLLRLSLEGDESAATDDFRDHLRRYGIKIYTERPFGNSLG
jgi:acetyltransferase-like isoleucine patch superfamily enzyme